MAQTQASRRTPSLAPSSRRAAPLSTVVYRSKAVRGLSPPELQELTAVAQSRNGREAVTGLMLYDDSRFFQWLEGPGDSVERIMGSIRADRRHTDIEVLRNQPARTRAFGDWTMKLAAQLPDAVAAPPDVLKPPRKIVDDLRQRPEAAPVLLLRLVPGAARTEVAETAATADALARTPLARSTAAILRGVILAAVIPELAEGHGASPPAPRPVLAHARVAELADLLVGTDQYAAAELIGEMRGGLESRGAVYAGLFEPAARVLGDLWSEDIRSEWEVTLGLCRLQAAARLLGAVPARPAGAGRGGSRRPRPAVLIAPEPGELHRLGATLDSEVLQEAGWSPRCEFPRDDEALQELLSGSWIDVLDLSLSTAFRREHRLARMRDTILRARRASRNPALVVVVGGRAFVETRTAGSAVGADVAATTALHIDRLMLHGLQDAHAAAAGAEAA